MHVETKRVILSHQLISVLLLGFVCLRAEGAQIKVMCGRDYMSIRATEDFFLYHKVALEALRLPNASCHARREVIGQTAYFMFRVSKEKYLACGGKPLRKNTTHLLYSLAVQTEPQVTGNIIRDPLVKMDFTCIYPYVRRVSLPFPVRPISSETVLQIGEMDATIQMLLYADHTFAKAYAATPTIELRDKVYVEVAVTEPADYFLLRVNDCWATQSPQPNSTGLLHSLIRNGSEHTGRFCCSVLRTGSVSQRLLFSPQLCGRPHRLLPRPGRGAARKQRGERGGPLQLRHVPLHLGSAGALPALQRAALRAGRPAVLHAELQCNQQEGSSEGISQPGPAVLRTNQDRDAGPGPVQHPHHRGASRGRRLDSVLLPHRPHQCGQGRQQEDHETRSPLTAGGLNRTLSGALQMFQLPLNTQNTLKVYIFSGFSQRFTPSHQKLLLIIKMAKNNRSASFYCQRDGGTSEESLCRNKDS
uniref:Uromodulin-like n=1 Tax=Fundulus heteroclitus TaxID=8078 RepID=A0A3Q2P723_FUNHE